MLGFENCEHVVCHRCSWGACPVCHPETARHLHRHHDFIEWKPRGL